MRLFHNPKDYEDGLALLITAIVVSFFMVIGYYDGFIRIGLLSILSIFIIGWAFSYLKIRKDE